MGDRAAVYVVEGLLGMCVHMWVHLRFFPNPFARSPLNTVGAGGIEKDSLYLLITFWLEKWCVSGNSSNDKSVPNVIIIKNSRTKDGYQWKHTGICSQSHKILTCCTCWDGLEGTSLSFYMFFLFLLLLHPVFPHPIQMEVSLRSYHLPWKSFSTLSRVVPDQRNNSQDSASLGIHACTSRQIHQPNPKSVTLCSGWPRASPNKLVPERTPFCAIEENRTSSGIIATGLASKGLIHQCVTVSHILNSCQ